jgi:putative membrane protein
MAGGRRNAMRLAVSMIALLVLAGCGESEGVRPSAAVEDNVFLANALAHTRSELELAQMAQSKAHTPSLTAYARRVASQRAALLDKLTAAAQPRGIAGDRNHTPVADSLKPLQGEAFERAYVASQIEDQRNNLDGFAFTAATGADPAIKALATGALPQLQQDYTDALNVVRDLPFERTTDSSQGGLGDRPMR